MKTFTLAKSRHSGKWVVVGSPEDTYSDNETKFNALTSTDVNKDWSEVVIGNLHETRPGVLLLSEDEKKAAAAAHQKQLEHISKVNEDARVREAERAAKERYEKEQKHKAEIDRINAINDATRTRGAGEHQLTVEKAKAESKRLAEEQAAEAAAAKKAAAEKAAAEKAAAEKAAAEKAAAESSDLTAEQKEKIMAENRAVLSGKSKEELLAIVEQLNAEPTRTNKIVPPGRKSELIEVILNA